MTVALEVGGVDFLGGAIVFALLILAALVARRGHWRRIRVGVFLEREEPLDPPDQDAG